jgi:hypothetical protein
MMQIVLITFRRSRKPASSDESGQAGSSQEHSHKRVRLELDKKISTEQKAAVFDSEKQARGQKGNMDGGLGKKNKSDAKARDLFSSDTEENEKAEDIRLHSSH